MDNRDLVRTTELGISYAAQTRKKFLPIFEEGDNGKGLFYFGKNKACPNFREGAKGPKPVGMRCD